METSAKRPDHNLWPGISSADPIALRAWLAALGFTEGILVPGDEDREVVHSEMLWPEGGRVMIHSPRPTDDPHQATPGRSIVYVVTDDPDAVLARAQGIEAVVARGMAEEDYGSRGFTLTDAEGNSWSFGTYAG